VVYYKKFYLKKTNFSSIVSAYHSAILVDIALSELIEL
jgi:hypothetical protein